MSVVKIRASYAESCYNETIAQLWFPKTREEVLKLGWRWQDNPPGTSGKETITELSDSIDDIDTSITGEILCCATCQKNYRVVAQELAFYLQNKLPITRECFDCRRSRRFYARAGRDMRMVTCCACGENIPTVYKADFEGKIYCEKCYRKSL